MPRVETIVVGGGIGAGSPFTVNRIPYIANVDPPLLVASPNMLQVVAGNIGITISPTGADPDPTGTEILRVSGGITSMVPGTGNRAWGDDISIEAARVNCLAVGRLITVTGRNGQIVIGNTITTDAGDVVIGSSITIGTGFNFGSIVIGTGTIGNGTGGGSGDNLVISNSFALGAGGPQGNIAIGSTFQGGSGLFENVSLGRVNTLGNSSAQHVVVGGRNVVAASTQRSVTIGYFHTINHDSCVVIGQGITTTAAGQCFIGNTINVGTTPIILGGWDVSVNAYPVVLRLTNEVGTDVAGQHFTIRPGMGTGNSAAGGNIIFQTGGVGASGLTLQTPVTRLTIAQEAILAALPLEMQVNNGYQAINQVDEAGSDAGTLANAPAAGDPTFWLPVRINGNDFAIPCWPV